MKKSLVLSLVLVLAFSAVAFAAETKLNGEVRLNWTLPGNSGDPYMAQEYRIKINTTINESTSGFIFLRQNQDATNLVLDPATTTAGKADDWRGVLPNALYYAEINTQLAGGTARFGRVEFGSAPWAIFGGIAGNRDGSIGVTYVSPDMNGLAFQGFLSTAAEKKYDLAGEATYKLGEGSVGVAFDKAAADSKSGFSVFGSYPVVKDTLTVMAEYGKDAAEADVQIIGASGTVGGVAYLFEGDIKAKKNYIQGGYTFNGVTYTVSYQTGDGYGAGTADNGKLNVQAKIKF